MGTARFMKVCVDANDPSRLGRFWADVLALGWRPDDAGEGGLFSDESSCVVWVNEVPEPKSAKHRVHLDIYTADMADLDARGARVVVSQGGDRVWTVMADPEGGEFCAFVRREPPARLLHGLVVDSADPASQARWWAGVFGATASDDPAGHSTVSDVPGMPILTMDFNAVPEPKTVKNRIHWDVAVPDPRTLLDAGATMLQQRHGDIEWDVLADPEGNEFCAFTRPR